MAAGDTLEPIRQNDQLIFDVAGNLSGIRNPRANGSDLRVAGYVGSDTYLNITSAFPAASFSGYQAFISDWGAGGTLARSNGTRWVPVSGRILLKHLGAAVTGIANTATIVLQTPAMPVGSVQSGDTILMDILGITKSGATDALVWTAYAGTAGTTADTAIANTATTALNAANVTGSALVPFKIVSNTSVQRAAAMSGVGAYGGATATAAPAPVTVTDLSANALVFSFAIASSGTTNTVGIQDGAIWQIVN